MAEQDEKTLPESVLAGMKLASPSAGEEVVISGMSGKFPNTRNVEEFRYNLLNKIDMVTSHDTDWTTDNVEIPKRMGKLLDLNHFDAEFFGSHPRQTNSADPGGRIILEQVVEAIFDAGYNLTDMQGSKTNVYIGSCLNETEHCRYFIKPVPDDYAIVGCAKSMLANRVSYWLGLNGTSFTQDTACSSAGYCLEQAYRDMRENRCDYALVSGANLILNHESSLQFARLGVLSMDGKSKSFDESADGYARSEGVCTVFLEKTKSAKRIYATIIHGKVNCDGFKQEGITFPSASSQKSLLNEFYQECNIDPRILTFLEAHGTGTKVGDPEELNTIDQVFCCGRNKPLLIGSVKSNIGHNESTSGMCSIIKAIIAMETGIIPPNIHFKNIRQCVEGLKKKRMIVVDEKTFLPDNNGLIGVNCFGFGGANSHFLLKWNDKAKKNNGQPKDNIPRLICVSARVPGGVGAILDDVKSRKLDAEYVMLLQTVFRNRVPGHRFRGYSIVSKSHGELKRSECIFEELDQKNIILLFGDPSKTWIQNSLKLMDFELFSNIFSSINQICYKLSIPVNLLEIGKTLNECSHLEYTIASICIHLSLTDLLEQIGLKKQCADGYSIGVIAAFYANGTISKEEAILYAFYTSICFSEMKFNHRNLPDSCLEIKECLVKNFSKVSTNQPDINKEIAEQIVNGNIKVNRPNSSVLIAIGISLQDTFDSNIVQLVDETPNYQLLSFLDRLGRLYEFGIDFSLEKLYKKIPLPVSRGTPGLAHLIKWKHDKDWFVYRSGASLESGQCFKTYNININETKWKFLEGHLINGRKLFPATGYLYLVWNTFTIKDKMFIKDSKVIFRDIRFKQAVNLNQNNITRLTVHIQTLTGYFEVSEGNICLVQGHIEELRDYNEFSRLNQSVSSDIFEVPLYEKDIYKELRLRGYNYSGLFRSLTKVEENGKIGYVQWKNNLIAFLDCMLQIKLLQEDTRNLFVPTEIERVVIDAKGHYGWLAASSDKPEIPVYVDCKNGNIKTKFIEVSGLYASQIAKKKPTGEPILEIYKFIPNIYNTKFEESIRVNMQIILENSLNIKVKALEIPSHIKPDYKFVSPEIVLVLRDLPLMQPEIFLKGTNDDLKQNHTELDGVSLCESLSMEKDFLLIMVSFLSKNPQTLHELLPLLKDDGYILSREQLNDVPKYPASLVILTIHEIEEEQFVLLKKNEQMKNTTIIHIMEPNFKWLPILQNAMTTNNDILLVSHGSYSDGILGLVNCVRKEQGGKKVRAVFICDENAPTFNINCKFFKEILCKKLAINVYKDNSWGTYRHVLLPETSLVEAEHSYLITSNPGDLSTLKWIEGTLKHSERTQDRLRVQVVYTALNFRDIMTATGKISADVITKDRTKQMCLQGFEYSGISERGERICGLMNSGAHANILDALPELIWRIPSHWTYADAATVPCIYSTVIVALIEEGKLQHGESILIHSGTGGIGQAAINIALFYNCTVFTTVGSEEKRKYIKMKFPEIIDTHIGNSRDISFEEMVMNYTNGRGVDLVLNSLSEEKLQASVRCLAKGGRFLEIGKYDAAQNNPLYLDVFKKGASFHCIMLDLFMSLDSSFHQSLTQKIQKFIDNGAVKPLEAKIFKVNEAEQAFRYMATGNHMGKILLQIQNEEPQEFSKISTPFKCHARYYCDSEKSFIIVGGLGGFGLELADWLILRGCKNLILTSRKGISTGYQYMRLQIWKSYGVRVVVSTDDVSDREQCIQMIKKANILGPVQAIFNLGVVLCDAALENQTVKDFGMVFAPKALATQYLDEISRIHCPMLRDFVVFSSVSCGRGNIGQTNYGMANSVMERICEKRKKDGLPGLAIQWGAIGDVGLVAQMQESNIEIVIGGTLQQRISNCLEILDVFLKQKNPVVASMVVAEKRFKKFGSVIDSIAHILGLKDLKTVNPNATLPELGMDSMSALEIKQILEIEYDLILSPIEIRAMTFTKIRDMQNARDSTQIKETCNAHDAFQAILSQIIPKSTERALQPYIKLENSTLPNRKLFIIPGIQGFYESVKPLADQIEANTYVLQYCYDREDQEFKSMAQNIVLVMKQIMETDKTFNLVAYSFGTVLSLEAINILEQEGYSGKAMFIDGSPAIFKTYVSSWLGMDSLTVDTNIVMAALGLYGAKDELKKLQERLLACKSFEEILKIALDAMPNNIEFPLDLLEKTARGLRERLTGLIVYEKSYNKIKTPCMLIKPSSGFSLNIHEDYQLSLYVENLQAIETYEGDHTSILVNPNTNKIVHKYFGFE